jgi:hypothetical protein
MVELGEDLALRHEARLRILARAAAAQQLERSLLPVLAVAPFGQVDLAHAAAPQHPHDPPRTQFASDPHVVGAFQLLLRDRVDQLGRIGRGATRTALRGLVRIEHRAHLRAQPVVDRRALQHGLALVRRQLDDAIEQGPHLRPALRIHRVVPPPQPAPAGRLHGGAARAYGCCGGRPSSRSSATATSCDGVVAERERINHSNASSVASTR